MKILVLCSVLFLLGCNPAEIDVHPNRCGIRTYYTGGTIYIISIEQDYNKETKELNCHINLKEANV